MKYLCFLLVSCHGVCCFGKVVVQLDGKRAGGVSRHEVAEGTNTWLETTFMSNQGFALRGKDWMETEGGGVANSKGAEAGPLVFGGDAPEVGVRSVVMVVKAAPLLRMRETLVCGAEVFRLAGRPLNAASGNVRAVVERGGVCEVESWKVDMEEGAEVEAAKLQLIEITFRGNQKLSEIALGGDWGRREWRRAWGGGFFEVIGFDDVPSAAVMPGVRNYLNVKWKLGLGADAIATDAQRSAAQRDGVNMGSLFATLFMVR